MSTTTTRFSFTKPTPGGDANTWGDLLNANWDALDALLQSKAQIVDFVYPVGTVIVRGTAADPNTDYPGTTWVLDAQNRAIVGAGISHALGSEFGADNYDLTIDNIPSHTHGFSATSGAGGGHSHTSGNLANSNAGAHSHSVSGSTSNTGNHEHIVRQTVVQRASGGLGSGDTVVSNGGDRQANTSTTGAHSHNVSGNTSNTGSHGHNINGSVAAVGNHTHSVSGTTDATGAATVTAVPLDQPSKAFNIWRRTA